MADISRLSLNQATMQHWSVQMAVEGCVRHGIPSIALWRDKIACTGLKECVKLVRDANLHVSSVCRGGMFPASSVEERRRRVEDNFRAVDEAAALDADSLVIVVGAAPEVPIMEARAMVADGLAEVAVYARKCAVRLGLEPLHPMYAADRSVLNTIEQALQITSAYPKDEVGVILDAFHIWWDPYVFESIGKCAGRIFGFHVCDWLVPLPNHLLGRGMMGDGVIDIHMLRSAVDDAGFSGLIEVEIFNQEIWDSDGDEVLSRIIERFWKFV